MDQQPPKTSAPRRDPYRLTGEVFGGRYRLEEFAGAGSFGAVYRATDARIERTVAVKILKPDIPEAEIAGARELFQREALTAGRLVHPNIVAVTDTGEEGDFAYLVMEWLEGRTLENELRERAPLAPVETATLLSSIADALQAAHDAGVVHRDIKPSNIHLGRRGRAYPKVLDFGIAKVLTSSSAANASRIAGTLSYMAPEQLIGGPIDRRTDIYALGTMLYQMLSGRMPYDAQTQGQLIHQRIAETPPPLHTVRPDIPRALSDVLQRALSKNPDARQQSVQELYTEFVSALEPQSFETEVRPLDESSSARPATQTQQGVSTPPTQNTQASTSPRPDATRPPSRDTRPLTEARPAQQFVPTVVESQGTVQGVSGTQAAARQGTGTAAAARAGSDTISGLKQVGAYAVAGAILFSLLSVGVGLLARWLGLSQTPFAYDDFALQLIALALRDGLFGALLGAGLSELRVRDSRWSVAGNCWARALVVHGALGASLLMFPFILLRTSLFVLPLGLAIIGAFGGLFFCGFRILAHKIGSRR